MLNGTSCLAGAPVDARVLMYNADQKVLAVKWLRSTSAENELVIIRFRNSHALLRGMPPTLRHGLIIIGCEAALEIELSASSCQPCLYSAPWQSFAEMVRANRVAKRVMIGDVSCGGYVWPI